jgi:hypothetical protein
VDDRSEALTFLVEILREQGYTGLGVAQLAADCGRTGQD